ncbi:copper homeostasis protein cutC homolog isoform X2 [Passer montanus]|uniref:copper homeostasis protein cutC homolog isoform X2 n=1 Tax=Passer montanus TaxID=9160 RepID=UPI0019618984|nr:copper homeostasis protein cutC homolog isoform X2 [Passer montanus]
MARPAVTAALPPGRHGRWLPHGGVRGLGGVRRQRGARRCRADRAVRRPRGRRDHAEHGAAAGGEAVRAGARVRHDPAPRRRFPLLGPRGGAVCRPLPVTFHRAFDMVHDPVVALETLISLGFERVLTSGCDSSALEGLSLIKRLAEQAKGRIVVVPGGGITERNLQRILEGSTASEFHCSARSARDSGMKFRNPNVAMGASFSAPEYSIKVADVAKVRTLNAIAKNIL